MKKNISQLIFILFAIHWLAVERLSAQEKPTNLTDEQRYEKYLGFNDRVKDIYVKPIWLPDGNRFWYAGGKSDSTIFYEINPTINIKNVVFDAERLRDAFKNQIGYIYENKGIPFGDLKLINGTDSVAFEINSKKYILDLRDYKITPKISSEGTFEQLQLSPDKRNAVFLKDQNVWVSSNGLKEKIQLTSDGTADYFWNISGSVWSADGKKILLRKLDDRKVHHIPIVDYSKSAEEVDWTAYARTGDHLEIPELYIIDIETKEKIKIETGTEKEQYIFPLGWHPNGSEIYFIRLNRQCNKMELLAASPSTGESRVILTEENKTFVAGLDFIVEKWVRQFTLLKDGTRFLWISERDGWRHTHSSPGRSPIVELRKSDGKLLQILKKADVSELKKIGWNTPETFIVKAADGVTDLYGILYKPYNFDHNKKYPVIDFIYGGAFTTIVPRGFIPTTSLSLRAQALAQLGYITFLVDGRGTTERSKAFQDVIYGNIGKYEIPDHAGVLQQLAAKHPYMDLRRVGIYGHSWGGYFALRALLTYPNLYHVGIASAPGDTTEGAEVNEPYMGLLEDNKTGYEYSSNINFAKNLQGKLLLIHGTSDSNAPFSVTVRMINALIKANKQYDLLLLPQRGHFMEDEEYVSDAVKNYFEKNLKKKNAE
ncbi:S9 family peptidase [Chryseobacterium daeguense]|uniref:S9 family peptidase n=1 Tax=Chryseobacterium daeguense TaxID=412438 RepID=UPI0003F92B61|nr:prolyl oligopeptidase family serine peptidase [Chryseobacterium daeguense]